MAKNKKETFEKGQGDGRPKGEAQEARRWLDRIQTSVKYRERMATDHRWETFLDEYVGKYDVELSDIKAPPVNEVFAFVQSALAGLFFRDPYISANPQRGGDLKGARLWEQVLNYYWRELGTKDEIESEIMDALMVGHAWHKTGYSVTTSGESDNLKITDEKLYSVRVSWRDVVFNVGCRKPPKDCQWMAHRIIIPTMDVIDKYPRAKGLKGGVHPDLTKDEAEQTVYKDDILFSILWEVHDARKKEIILLAEGHDKILKRGTWPKYMDRFPLLMLWFNKINDEPYPMSDIAPWEPQILEEIKMWAMALNHVKRWNRQLLVKKGTMTSTALDKFAKGSDGAIIETNTDPNTTIREIEFGALPPDIYLLFDRLAGVMRNVNGQPEFDKGGTTPTKTRTLGELQLIKSGAKSRTDRKVDRIETHCETIARQMLAHIKGNFNQEKDIIVRITEQPTEELVQTLGNNFDPVSQTVKFKPSEIAGEYDVSIKKGSTLPLDNQTKLQLLQGVLETLAPIIGAGPMPRFIQVVVLEMLRDFGMKTLEVAFEQMLEQQEADAIQAQKAQNLEDKLSEADIARKGAQTAKLTQDSVVSTAKAVTDAAGLGLDNIVGGGTS